MKSLIELVAELRKKMFWGEVTIKFKNGKLVKADVSESIELRD